MAGEATAVAAAPAAETFKKSRRFIRFSLGVFPGFQAFLRRANSTCSGALWRGQNMEVRLRERDKGMTALIKPKSHRLCEMALGRSDNALKLFTDFLAD